MTLIYTVPVLKIAGSKQVCIVNSAQNNCRVDSVTEINQSGFVGILVSLS